MTREYEIFNTFFYESESYSRAIFRELGSGQQFFVRITRIFSGLQTSHCAHTSVAPQSSGPRALYSYSERTYFGCTRSEKHNRLFVREPVGPCVSAPRRAKLHDATCARRPGDRDDHISFHVTNDGAAAAVGIYTVDTRYRVVHYDCYYTTITAFTVGSVNSGADGERSAQRTLQYCVYKRHGPCRYLCIYIYIYGCGD